MLRNLWLTQCFTPYSIRMLLAKTYLIPTLLYGCEIFIKTDFHTFSKLERLYNNIARYIFNKRKYDHISEYTQKIFGLSFRKLLDFRGLILLHKIIVTKTPKYLFNRIKFCKSNRHKTLIAVRCAYSSSEGHFFVYVIPLWNSLPKEIRSINGVSFPNIWVQNKMVAMIIVKFHYDDLSKI